MQQYTGWICKFTSETFGVFDGVMTDISYETESGDVDEDDNSFNSLTVESNGFFVDESFDRFYDMVLKIEV